MTAPQLAMVVPSARPGWHGPVVELTSRYSVSAVETFTQALMGRRPAVDRIGEHTNGVFSGVPNRHLPNGWIFGLPNELYLTERGTSFDVSGIPPTIPVPTLRTADLAAGRGSGTRSRDRSAVGGTGGLGEEVVGAPCRRRPLNAVRSCNGQLQAQPLGPRPASSNGLRNVPLRSGLSARSTRPGPPASMRDT